MRLSGGRAAVGTAVSDPAGPLAAIAANSALRESASLVFARVTVDCDVTASGGIDFQRQFILLTLLLRNRLEALRFLSIHQI
jgi:hypothetical protein